MFPAMKRILFAASVLLGALTATAAGVKVEFFTPSTVRIVKTPDGKPAADRVSEVVTATPENVMVRVSQRDGMTEYRSSALTVKVDDATGRVSYFTPAGKELLKEGSYGFTPIGAGPDSLNYRVMQEFAVAPDEPIYGLGMMQNGKLSQRGEHRMMMQTNLEDFAHFFQSLKGYGIYWDNYSPVRFDDNTDALRLESSVGDCVDYYFMYGGDADGVIASMRTLTGEVPMLPLWTYGFHQSRERYKTADELLSVVDGYRSNGIPLDGIIQDWQYWGSNYNWNAMEFLSPDYDRAPQMIDRVHDSGAKLLISIWSSFGPMTKPYQELDSLGLLFDFSTWPQSGLTQWPPRRDYPSGVRVYDCYSPEARDIYWRNLTRLHDLGVDAWWMDSTDPDHLDYADSDLDQLTSTGGTFRSVRNLFPFKAVGGVDSHQRAVDSLKRVFILTRSYFAGQQRYGANTWSGDVGSSWESLRNQVPLCLSHTLTANPNVNTDIGGFFAGTYNSAPEGFRGVDNPQFRELYVRWMQFGLFSPMMRSHGTDVPREIYLYGKPGEPVYDALVDAVKMRYRLLPYIYSTARRVSADNDSFMRALFMDFAADSATHNLGREFMFGRSLLVCPVVDPLYTPEATVRTDEISGWNAQPDGNGNNVDLTAVDWTAPRTYEVYLPAGARWWDFYTGKLHDGGTALQADAPISHSPLYVKAGSIVPLGRDLQWAQEKPWDEMTLAVYPGADAEFTLYEDEGDGYNYLKGAFSEIPMSWDDRSHTLTIGRREGSFPGMLAERTFTVALPDGTSRTVSYTGRPLKVKL